MKFKIGDIVKLVKWEGDDDEGWTDYAINNECKFKIYDIREEIGTRYPYILQTLEDLYSDEDDMEHSQCYWEGAIMPEEVCDKEIEFININWEEYL